MGQVNAISPGVLSARTRISPVCVLSHLGDASFSQPGIDRALLHRIFMAYGSVHVRFRDSVSLLGASGQPTPTLHGLGEHTLPYLAASPGSRSFNGMYHVVLARRPGPSNRDGPDKAIYREHVVQHPRCCPSTAHSSIAYNVHLSGSGEPCIVRIPPRNSSFITQCIPWHPRRPYSEAAPSPSQPTRSTTPTGASTSHPFLALPLPLFPPLDRGRTYCKYSIIWP